MANEITFFIIIILLFLFVVFLSLAYEAKQKRGVISYFVSRGFIQSQPDKLNFIDPETGIRYEIEKFYRGVGRNRKSFYRLTLLTNSENHYQFTITKRGGLSKIFGVNKGIFNSLHEDFNISSTHPQQIFYLFSDEVFNKLERLFVYAHSLSVESQGGLLAVEVELRYNNSKLFDTVEFTEFLIPNLTSPFELDLSDYEEYLCFNCNTKISYVGEICTNCGVIAPKCVICFDDPEPNEDVILFDCCKSYAHSEHALTWIRKENICPSCRTEEPKLIPIKENPK